MKKVIANFLAYFIWVPIEYAPLDKEILAASDDFVFITKYSPENVDGSGFGIIHSC